VSPVLLDTNVFSYVLKKHDLARLYDKHLDGRQQTLCFAVVAELMQGAMVLKWTPARIAQLEERLHTVTIIPYDIGVCRAWANLCDAKNHDGSARSFGNNDRWIAACAIHHGVPLISHNRRHFTGIPGLTLISEAPL
jgi:predicted nucleic acid-binding protein